MTDHNDFITNRGKGIVQCFEALERKTNEYTRTQGDQPKTGSTSSGYKPSKPEPSRQQNDVEESPTTTGEGRPSGGGRPSAKPKRGLCNICGNDINFQPKRRMKCCNNRTQTCVLHEHPDLVGHDWNSKFYLTDNDKAYKFLDRG